VAERPKARTKHHQQPRKGAQTKWAASPKGTAARPARASARAGKLGDLLVRQAVALQPQYFHLALDVRVRVMIPLVLNRFQLFFRKAERAHRCYPEVGFMVLPCHSL
jgi:hypothetical protein